MDAAREIPCIHEGNLNKDVAGRGRVLDGWGRLRSGFSAAFAVVPVAWMG